MDFLLQYVLPVNLTLIMFIVGMELTFAQVKEAIIQFKLLFLAICLQLSLPISICLILINLFEPHNSIVIGMLLITSCPGGTLSNFYTYLARGDIAFSISLTSLSTLLAFISLPLLMSLGVYLSVDASNSFQVPIKHLVNQLFLRILLPIIAGMLVRHFFTTWYKNHKIKFRYASITLLSLIVLFVFYKESAFIQSTMLELFSLVVLFHLIIISLAFAFAKFLKLNKQRAISLLFELPVQNLGIAAITGVSIFGNTQFLAFAAAFFLLQIPLITLLIISLNHYSEHLWAN